MSEVKQTIGIIGAGKLGITLARIARHYGFNVNIAGSGDAKKIALTSEVLAPGTNAMTSIDVAKNSDIVILALPLGQFKKLPKQELAGKLVIDAMNHWWEIDGDRSDIMPDEKSSSEAVQQFLSESRVVKGFNHMGYHDLFDEHRPHGTEGRKAIAVAGDSQGDVVTVLKLIDDLGFDPVVIGNLSEGRRLEPGTNMFGADVNAAELKHLIDAQSNS
jgi:predicted dinucleotide-binding enzyme